MIHFIHNKAYFNDNLPFFKNGIAPAFFDPGVLFNQSENIHLNNNNSKNNICYKILFKYLV